MANSSEKEKKKTSKKEHSSYLTRKQLQCKHIINGKWRWKTPVTLRILKI